VASPAPVTGVTRRELVLAAAVGLATALVMHWPLPAGLGGEVPGNLGDPLFQAWQVAWGGYALAHQPLEYFQANDYWPLRNTLAFSDALVGYAPAGLIGSGPEAAVVRYNLLFLFAYWLAFFGTYLLARELGAGPLGAAVAGAAFAYAPWRLDQVIHLNVLSSGGIPLSLFLLVRGYRRRRPRLVLSGWLVATWQLSLGFNLGLQLAYLLVVAGVGTLALWRRTPRLRRGLAAATAGGMAIFVAVGILLSRPYVQVANDYPEARRPAEMVAGFSPPLRGYLAAPEHNLLWGEATRAIRDQLPIPAEQSLFPGLVVLLLAALGFAATSVPRRLRLGLAAAVIVCALLALGFRMGGVRELAPYRLLYELLPGWDAVRVPGRMNTLTSLALALLAGLGAHAVARLVRGRWALAGYSLAAVLPVAVLVEGLGSAPLPEVPKPPAGQMSLTAPQYHLPPRGLHSTRYLLWSTRGYPQLVNGHGSFVPRIAERAASITRSFPDRRSVAWLRALGVRTVIVHPDLARGSEWARAVTGDVKGLPLRRTVRNEVVIFALAATHGEPGTRARRPAVGGE
jgi:hypothetical protein